jgi:hypothetical protein
MTLYTRLHCAVEIATLVRQQQRTARWLDNALNGNPD